jgi:hypothetical protein
VENKQEQTGGELRGRQTRKIDIGMAKKHLVESSSEDDDAEEKEEETFSTRLAQTKRMPRAGKSSSTTHSSRAMYPPTDCSAFDRFVCSKS